MYIAPQHLGTLHLRRGPRTLARCGEFDPARRPGGRPERLPTRSTAIDSDFLVSSQARTFEAPPGNGRSRALRPPTVPLPSARPSLPRTKARMRSATRPISAAANVNLCGADVGRPGFVVQGAPRAREPRHGVCLQGGLAGASRTRGLRCRVSTGSIVSIPWQSDGTASALVGARHRKGLVLSTRGIGGRATTILAPSPNSLQGSAPCSRRRLRSS